MKMAGSRKSRRSDNALFDMMASIKAHPELSAHAVLVGLMLADAMWWDPERGRFAAAVKAETLAGKARISEKSADRALAELRKAGLIASHSRYRRENGRILRGANCYEMDPFVVVPIGVGQTLTQQGHTDPAVPTLSLQAGGSRVTDLRSAPLPSVGGPLGMDGVPGPASRMSNPGPRLALMPPSVQSVPEMTTAARSRAASHDPETPLAIIATGDPERDALRQANGEKVRRLRATREAGDALPDPPSLAEMRDESNCPRCGRDSCEGDCGPVEVLKPAA